MNELFLKRMKELLKDDFDDYLHTLDIKPFKGLRVNTLKIDVDTFKSMMDIELKPSKYCANGFYVDSCLKLGKHPFHQMGLFYMQEPSASSSGTIMHPEKNSLVLDLCSAPGGKSGQIAEFLNNTGLLISNEIDNNRCNILLSNMERLGVSNCIITNARPTQICKALEGNCDYVMVDAPCSGEGMFKKESKALEDWSIEHVISCSNRQSLILNDAYMALKQNGILVYSTCTYSKEENELVIKKFIDSHPDMQLVEPIEDFGRKGYCFDDFDGSKTRRIFPMDEGEGHFVAKLIKTGEQPKAKLKPLKSNNIDKCVKEFMQQYLKPNDFKLYQINNKVYLSNHELYDLNVKTLRSGVLCGEVIKNRFEPHQHFFTASLLQDYHINVYDMSEEEYKNFISGNCLNVNNYKGYVCLTYKNYPVGFGKGDNNIIKNKFPKGLRVIGG